MVNVIETAREIGCLAVPEETLIDIEKLKNYPNEKTVIITTGSQGESMAALSRMANGTHRKVTITGDDTIIFSSHPIPGNEKAITKVINELSRKGADVIFQDAHVSGHACQEEIKLIYALTQPKYAIPIHGEYKHLIAQGKIALGLGLPKEDIFILNSGDVLELDQEEAKIIGKVPAGAILVDGLGVGDVGNVVLKDRQHLAEDGILIVIIGLEKGSRALVSGPEIVTRGFVYVKEADELMEEARVVCVQTLEKTLNRNVTDYNKIRNTLRDALSEFVWRKTKRRPIILSIIMDVE